MADCTELRFLYNKHMRKSGFSLVELSIVLVILGLLTGGILAGQSLIRASEIRSVTTEYDRFMTAVTMFRDKYSAMPGDFNEATRYWGKQVAAGWCTSSSGAAVNPSGNGVCDGNNDRMVDGYAGPGTHTEPYQFWRHLAVAGLIEGNYSGTDGVASIGCDANNCPTSKIPNARWTHYVFYPYGTVTNRQGTLEFGIPGSLSNRNTTGAIKPEEAWNLDTKMDDGVAIQGKMRTASGNACINGSSVYNVQNSTLACALQFSGWSF